MSSISFTIYGEVKGKMRPKATTFGGHARVYTPSAQIKNENWIKMEYLKAAEKDNFKGFGDSPIQIEIYHYMKLPTSFSKKKASQALKQELFPTKKPDLDNVTKTVLDALNGIAFDDDKNIVRIEAFKRYATSDYTIVYLSTYPEELLRPYIGIDDNDGDVCL